jgi:tRNA 2-selenouridine synthase
LAKSISPYTFLSEAPQGIMVDVRTPAEYKEGHIPFALSIPLFDDYERSVVGTLYKTEGKTSALLKGLELVGPKLKMLSEKALQLSNGKPIYLYCWRGGMRSSSMAWLFETIGIECYLLKGGYKSYRNYILNTFKNKYLFKVIGGKTGSGKTKILTVLANIGEQVVDLEALAHHKGSAFGRMGEKEQPSTEQFGNELYEKLRHLDANKTIWLEDESHAIGSVFIPTEFYSNYRQAPLIVLDIPFEERLNYLVNHYGKYEVIDLKNAFEKIKRKLGGQNLNKAIAYLEEGDLKSAASIALNYYDETYVYGLQNKDTLRITYHAFDTFNSEQIAHYLIKLP